MPIAVLKLHIFPRKFFKHPSDGCDDKRSKCTYSNTSLIRTNWERTLVLTSESLNYGNPTENMFREVIIWTSGVFLGNTTLF